MEKIKILYGNIVTPTKILKGFIVTDKGKITGILNELSTAFDGEKFKIYDYSDKYIFPGFIDAHVHCFSNPKEGFESTSIGAAYGGVTTFVDMPYDRPTPIDNSEKFKDKVDRLVGNTVVDVALWGTIAKNDGVKKISDLIKAGAAAFKMSTFETDPQRFPKISDVDIYKSFLEVNKLGGFIAFHSENNEMIVDLIKEFKEKGKVYPKAHEESRPVIVETTAVQRLCEIAKWTNGNLHIVHVSAPETVDIIEEYRRKGVKVTCETCYHYLVMNVHDLEKMGPRAKMNPPLRETERVEKLWQNLIDGKINYVTSDHVPWDKKDKEKGKDNIFLSPSGLPGIELLGPVMFDAGVSKGRISPVFLSKILSTNIAKRFGFKQKGSIELGKDADFTIIDPKQVTKIQDDKLHTRVDSITPLDGKTLDGKVIATWVRGKEIFNNGQILVDTTYGKFVPGKGAMGLSTK